MKDRYSAVLSAYDETITRFYAGEEYFAYDFFGAHLMEDPKSTSGENETWLFTLWAPNAKSVSVAGDWNSWDPNEHKMTRYQGIWTALIEGPKHGDLYKFVVLGADGKRRWKADPFAFRAELPPGTASQLWDLNKNYEWSDKEWLKTRGKQNIFGEPVSIYEMNLTSWRISNGIDRAGNDPDENCGGIFPGVTASDGIKKQDPEESFSSLYPTFRETAPELARYLSKMGYTHVELMPINEYPFDGSWGYQKTGYFSITSRFGIPEDFMYFVDTLHAYNIGVIIDWAPSGFPKDDHGLCEFDGTRLYEHSNKLRRELPGWGTLAFILGRPEVKSFLISSAMLLMDTYHVDGIRVDAVSAMLYMDYERETFIPNKEGGNIDPDAVAFFKSLNKALITKNPGAVTIAEEATAFPLVTRPPEDGGLGFIFKWNMGYMNDTLNYMRTDPQYRKDNHELMTFTMYYAFSENYVLPYSHDEVVHRKASMLGKMSADYDGKFDSLKTLFAWQYAHPGKKLNFMGNELAQVIEWDHNKQLDWLLLNFEKHRGIQNWVRDLNNLYKKMKSLHNDEMGWDGFTWLNVDDRENSVFAFLRSWKNKRPDESGDAHNDEDEHIMCVFNFKPVEQENYVVALPASGELSLLINSNDPLYGGAGNNIIKKITSKKIKINGMEYGAALSLPPLSSQYYIYKKKELPRKRKATGREKKK